MDRQRTGQAVAGTLLVTMGIIVLGDRLGWGSAWNMGQLWPVLLIAAGAAQLLSSEHDRWRRSATFISTGVIFLFDRLHVMPLRASWPLFVVLVGVFMLFGGHRCRSRRVRVRHGE